MADPSCSAVAAPTPLQTDHIYSIVRVRPLLSSERANGERTAITLVPCRREDSGSTRVNSIRVECKQDIGGPGWLLRMTQPAINSTSGSNSGGATSETVSLLPNISTHPPVSTAQSSSRAVHRVQDFELDCVLGPAASQADVAHAVRVDALCAEAFAGKAVTVFCYGQTGSGKTFTISGRTLTQEGRDGAEHKRSTAVGSTSNKEKSNAKVGTRLSTVTNEPAPGLKQNTTARDGRASPAATTTGSSIRGSSMLTKHAKLDTIDESTSKTRESKSDVVSVLVAEDGLQYRAIRSVARLLQRQYTTHPDESASSLQGSSVSCDATAVQKKKGAESDSTGPCERNSEGGRSRNVKTRPKAVLRETPPRVVAKDVTKRPTSKKDGSLPPEALPNEWPQQQQQNTMSSTAHESYSVPSEQSASTTMSYTRATVRVSYLELYNEQLYDLLRGGEGGLRCRWSAEADCFYVENALLVECVNEEELLMALREGQMHRQRASHRLNADSSRSHCIFTIYVETQRGAQSSVNARASDSHPHYSAQSSTEAADKQSMYVSAMSYYTEPPLHGKLTFVDLAGSERLKLTGSSGDDTKSINRSLFMLGNVIEQLSKQHTRPPREPHARHTSRRSNNSGNNKKDSSKDVHQEDKLEQTVTRTREEFVPYRSSLLTQLLMDSLRGNCRTVMIACVAPSLSFSEESLRTIHYAQRARNVHADPAQRVDAVEQERHELRQTIRLLRAENRALRAALHLSESGSLPGDMLALAKQATGRERSSGIVENKSSNNVGNDLSSKNGRDCSKSVLQVSQELAGFAKHGKRHGIDRTLPKLLDTSSAGVTDRSAADNTVRQQANLKQQQQQQQQQQQLRGTIIDAANDSLLVTDTDAARLQEGAPTNDTLALLEQLPDTVNVLRHPPVNRERTRELLGVTRVHPQPHIGGQSVAGYGYITATNHVRRTPSR